MKDEKKNALSRRDYLAGGAALVAGAVLPGCGGGDEEGLGEAPLSQEGTEGAGNSPLRASPAAYTVVKFNTSVRSVIHVEVAHRGLLATDVSLAVGTGVITYISQKAASSTATAYSLDYATLETTPKTMPDNDNTRAELYNNLRLYATIGGTPFRAGLSVPGGTSPTATRLMYTTDGIAETEWLFARTGDATTTNWDVAVRFFIETDATKMGPRRANWVSDIVAKDPHHDHNQGVTHTYPSFYPGLPAEAASVSLGVIRNPTNGADTLVVPSHRHANHFELVRPLGLVQTSTVAHDHHKRRIARHLGKYADSIQTESVATTANLGTKANRVHNELMKALFGHTIGDDITNAIANSVAKIQSAVDFTVNTGLENLASIADDLDTPGNQTAIQRSLQDTPRQPPMGTAGGGASSSVSLQAKVEGEFLMPFIAYPMHAGVRASLLIARATWASQTADGVNQSKSSSYRLSQRSTSGYKLTATGILGPTWPDTIFTVDVEVNVSMTIKRDASNVLRCRVDGITLDPVIDINLRSWTGAILEKMMGRILSTVFDFVTSGSAAVLASPMISGTAAQTLGAAAPSLSPGLAGGGLAAAAATQLETMAVALLQTAGRTWSLVEGSFLRMAVINGDSFDTYTGGFRPGFQGAASFAYMPGVKYLAGTGFSSTVGGVTGVFRIFGGADAYFIYGTRDVQGAVLNAAVTGGGGGGGG